MACKLENETFFALYDRMKMMRKSKEKQNKKCNEIIIHINYEIKIDIVHSNIK